MNYVVYGIRTRNNNKFYFGRSQEFEKRKRAHLNMLRSNTHNNYHLQQNFNHYGESDFEFIILFQFATLAEAQAKEAELIPTGDYNISDSATSGGNVFTRNPRKEEIRKMRIQQMSGQNNHQYGKPKSEKMINAVKESNSKKIIVDGIEYNSITEYSKIASVGLTTVSYRLNSKNFTNYQYA